jgi:hypothetical protein
MAGLTPKFNNRDIGRFYDKFQDDAEQKFIEVLTYAGEEGVKNARINGNYIDQTGNLRSSIGYAVVKDGQIVQQSFEKAGSGSDGDTGLRESKRLVSKLSSKLSTGIVLVLVAGMDYALYVENIKSKDVLSGAVTGTDRFLRETLKTIVNG